MTLVVPMGWFVSVRVERRFAAARVRVRVHKRLARVYLLGLELLARAASALGRDVTIEVR
jgi:hypothetical protein